MARVPKIMFNLIHLEITMNVVIANSLIGGPLWARHMPCIAITPASVWINELPHAFRVSMNVKLYMER